MYSNRTGKRGKEREKREKPEGYPLNMTTVDSCVSPRLPQAVRTLWAAYRQRKRSPLSSAGREAQDQGAGGPGASRGPRSWFADSVFLPSPRVAREGSPGSLQKATHPVHEGSTPSTRSEGPTPKHRTLGISVNEQIQSVSGRRCHVNVLLFHKGVFVLY